MEDLILAGIVGWCGTYWPRRFPFPIGGGGGGDPWPDGCEVCGDILGAIGGVVLWLVIGRAFEGSGVAEIAIVSFFGGAFLYSAVRGLMGLGNRGRVARPNG